LPGYTIPLAQVIGGTNLASNFVALAQFSSGTNSVATNSAAGLTNQFTLTTNLVFNATNTLATNFNAELTTATNNVATNVLASLISISNTLYLAIYNGLSNNAVADASNVMYFTNGFLSKAFSCTLPATYASIGIGFSTPLMPDGNFSVNLTPHDQNTANAYQAGLNWWVGLKNSSGFTIYADYATNFNLNFDCTVKENTQ